MPPQAVARAGPGAVRWIGEDEVVARPRHALPAPERRCTTSAPVRRALDVVADLRAARSDSTDTQRCAPRETPPGPSRRSGEVERRRPRRADQVVAASQRDRGRALCCHPSGDDSRAAAVTGDDHITVADVLRAPRRAIVAGASPSSSSDRATGAAARLTSGEARSEGPLPGAPKLALAANLEVTRRAQPSLVCTIASRRSWATSVSSGPDEQAYTAPRHGRPGTQLVELGEQLTSCTS